MKCPIDASELVISERTGIEIDYCPQCRGVWLDRGELDKLIDRSEQFGLNRLDTSRPANGTLREESTPQHGRPKKKRESFLGDLFDFGD